jgi:Uncharacterized protein conserved in bacteria (DUF2325)
MAWTSRIDLGALGRTPRASARALSFQLPPPPPVLIHQEKTPTPTAPRRTKIWELSAHLHCSIIGTCLSTTELRQILSKAKFVCDGASDHDLHGQGVQLAGQHSGAAKLLHKALDKRHRLVIARFEKVKEPDEVRALWRETVKRGDIPGGYWAVLTHPATTDAVVREVFGEVHMLSHLVGAAYRADIRRLNELEATNAKLQETLRRQQAQLREGFTLRDAKIRDLSALLARQLSDATRDDEAADGAGEQATLLKVIGDLERRLSSETTRRLAVERRLERLAEELRLEREQRSAAERDEAVLRSELEAVEASLARAGDLEDEASEATVRLDGLSLLYVGGRPHQLGHLRTLGERLGADFLHHDGGVDDRSGLLAGLVSRADIVMFPVDCVSHEAVLMVKRLCRQAAKPYLPLRSTGVSSFIAALARTEIRELLRAPSALTPA